jgi:hypothetical protein
LAPEFGNIPNFLLMLKGKVVEVFVKGLGAFL